MDERHVVVLARNRATRQPESSSSEDDSADSADSDDDSDDDESDDGPSEPLLELEPGWAAHVDPSSGHTYYCNERTGESQWETPGRRRAQPALQALQTAHTTHTQVQPVRALQQQPQQHWAAATYKPRKPAQASGVDSSDDSDDSDDSSSDDDDADDDADSIKGQEDVQSAVNFYVYTSLFHVVVVEAPLAAAEGIGRGSLELCAGATALARQTLAGAGTGAGAGASRSSSCGKARVHDGLRLLVVGISLLVPFFILFAYRDLLAAWREGRLERSAKVDDWLMRDLPTPFGNVDARRLSAVTGGQGAYATNVRNQRPS